MKTNDGPHWLTKLLVDKLVFGIVILMIGQIITGAFRRSERINETTMKVSSLQTELVQTHWRELTRAMGSYLQWTAGFTGQGKVPADKADILGEKLQDVETPVYQLSGLYPSFEEEAKVFLDSLRAETAALLEQRRDPGDIELRRDDLRDKYLTLIGILRKLAVAAVTDDRSAVEELLPDI